MAGGIDFVHVIRDLLRILFLFGQCGIAHDSVHRRANIVAHVGKEVAFGVLQQFRANQSHLVIQKVRGRKGLIYCTCYVVFLHQQLVIVVDPNYGAGRHGMEGLLYPYHGSNDDQGRHPHPAGSGLAKATVPVVLQKIQEEQAAYDTPEDEDNIGLRFQPGGHVFNRQEQEQSEKYGADTA